MTLPSLSVPIVFAALAALAPQERRPKPEPAVQLPEGFVRYARVPEGGIQPRVEVDPEGIALLYYKGDPTRGELFLTRSADEAKTFSPSVRVSKEGGAVLAQPSGHSGALAIGPEGRAHVSWVESVAVDGVERPTLRYVQERERGSFAEPIELGAPEGLCSSSTLAVDASGRVLLFFAARDAAAAQDGAAGGLRIWLRTSADGASFSEAKPIDNVLDGVSAGSGFAARIDRHRGTIYLLCVTAGRRGGAEVRLLNSQDGGESFESTVLEYSTRAHTDPRAAPGLSQAAPGEGLLAEPLVIVSWDTYGRVFWSSLDPIRRGRMQSNIPIEPRAEANVRRRHAVGQASATEYLLAWLEQPQGQPDAEPTLKWRVWYSVGLQPVGKGEAPEPVGASFPAVFANRGRGFTIVY
jgi:hypothetical protein